ncbi:MAG: right-handed parallel beta-helix repeat-containing protein [Candidatus Micrarchaeota archaeon]|nr:right-handed parallel beta-helix repeat-containing protein [Candidatus Micrarchaeota archaeon]
MQQPPAPVSTQPQQPQSPSPPSSQPSPKPRIPNGINKSLLIKLLAVVVVIAVVAVAYSQFSRLPHSTATTSSSAQTTIRLANINSCKAISSPGEYYITSDISTNIQNGSCISIRSSNVKLVGNGHKMTGNGPFVNTSPYSYAISIRNESNVTVSQLSISKFSYGIYAYNTSGSAFSDMNITNSTVASVYLYRSSNNSVSGSKLSGAQGKEGSLILVGGSGNKVEGTTINFNTYYGIYINSTGASLTNDTLANNPADLFCAPGKGYPSTSSFSGSSCYVNDYCNFAQCSQTNLVQDLTTVLLPSTISSCGNIEGSGTYTLSGNLSMGKYLNRSNPATNSIACITISAPSVYLDCNNMTISGSGIGIYSSLTSNVVVSNCNVKGSTTGIMFKQMVGGSIRDSTASNNIYSVYLDNSSLINITGVKQSRSKYGIYLNSSFITNVKGVSSQNNSYGMYIDNANVTSIINSTIVSNSKTDLFCAPSSYNSTTDSLIGTKCGSTDCSWASSSCTNYVLPPIATFPISSCMTISAPGNYSLSHDVSSSGTCFKIAASNVKFECGNHIISTSTGTMAAFSIDGQSNVSIKNCDVLNYAYGVKANDTRNLSISGFKINATQTAVLLSNSSLAKLSSVIANVFAKYGFAFDKVTSSNISTSSALAGASNTTGFSITNSTGNRFSYNHANQSAYGYYITNSKNNYIQNNTASLNDKYDFYCGSSDSGINDESGGVNTGETKQGCKWLALQSSTGIQQQCEAISLPSLITLTRDMVYPFGSTCFTIANTKSTSANNTLIDCNGHTVIATDGGTFLSIANSSSITLQNCYIKNFTNPVKVASSSSSRIQNNTLSSSQTAISASGSQSLTIAWNRIYRSLAGIVLSNDNGDNVQNNTISVSGTAINATRTKAVSLSNNTASKDSYGLSMYNSTGTLLQKNTLTNSSGYGISCYGLSASSSGGTDYGLNSCKGNFQCSWITSPNCH